MAVQLTGNIESPPIEKVEIKYLLFLLYCYLYLIHQIDKITEKPARTLSSAILTEFFIYDSIKLQLNSIQRRELGAIPKRSRHCEDISQARLLL